jgi:hypothetical protein
MKPPRKPRVHLRHPRAKPKKPKAKNWKSQPSVFDLMADILSEAIEKIVGGFAPPPVIQYFQCPQCGCIVGMNLHRTVRNAVPKGARVFCPAGHGAVMEPITLEQAQQADQEARRKRRVPVFAQVDKEKEARIQAAIFLASHSYAPKDYLLENKTARHLAYRKAAAKLHPDNKDTGDAEEFLKLKKAMETLEGGTVH